MNGKSFIQALNFSSNSDYKMCDYRYGRIDKRPEIIELRAIDW
jgi:hypothetical protein